MRGFSFWRRADLRLTCPAYSRRMCGRFVQTPVVNVPRGFAWPELGEPLAELPAHYNLAPGQGAGVVRLDGEAPVVDRMHWGLLPFWAKERKFGYSTINARIETVATKPAFRAAFKARRCLIPMAGYYEWTEPKPKYKQPWFIHRRDEAPLWAAGLWEPPNGLEGEQPLGTFTVITGGSSGVSADIHDRMPVIVPIGLGPKWLTAGPDDAMAILLGSELPTMEAYPVSRAVNTPRNDRAELLVPIDPDEALQVQPTPAARKTARSRGGEHHARR